MLWGPTNYRLLAEANLLEAYAIQSIMQLGVNEKKSKKNKCGLIIQNIIKTLE